MTLIMLVLFIFWPVFAVWSAKDNLKSNFFVAIMNLFMSFFGLASYLLVFYRISIFYYSYPLPSLVYIVAFVLYVFCFLIFLKIGMRNISLLM
jgi:hypothetical protein